VEESKALPKHCYGDPAIVAERNQLAELGCRACIHHTMLLARVVCTEAKVTNHKRVPFIGTKCKFFKLKD
jgi:hypothetical protein